MISGGICLCFRPLHIAARNGLATVVQALLNRGATVLAVDEEGEFCYSIVCNQIYVKIIVFILR